MGSHKKSGTKFCGKPVCVGDVQWSKGAMTEAQTGLRERNMSVYSVKKYLLGFRRISGVNILVVSPYKNKKFTNLNENA